MHDGIYRVTFENEYRRSETGVAVIRGEHLNGADRCFAFSGRITRRPDAVSVVLRARKVAPGGHAVFDQQPEIIYHLFGHCHAHAFALSGSTPDGLARVIHLQGVRLSGLDLEPAEPARSADP